MGFLGVYTAAYDYEPRAEGELAITEGDVLYVLDKGDNDGWWKAKKKAGAEDEDEPVGLVPNNYIEEAPILKQARAIYEYTRQTDEELSFPEEAILQVYDTSDPDWILVGLDDEYGFVPANYIQLDQTTEIRDNPIAAASSSLPLHPQSVVVSTELRTSSIPSPLSPTSALSGTLDGRSRTTREASESSPSASSQPARMRTQSSEILTSEAEANDNEAMSPTLPHRSRSKVPTSETSEDTQAPPNLGEVLRTPGGFHMYNINEMVSIMGKRKKMPTTLGINLGTGTILIAPDYAEDESPQEWTADKMTHYSREGKHVFMELVRPSKSIDFHAGAKDTAEEIVVALAELSGAVRAQGLREVILAGSQQRQRKGQVLYDFMAQGDDEVTVAAGDEVLIIDDSKSEEWWQVTRLKNGKEGVVPSSYIEITGTVLSSSTSNIHKSDLARGTVEKNRVEEIRLTKDAIKASKEPQQVGPGALHPERGSSLVAREPNNNSRQQRGKHENGRSELDNHAKPKSRPDSSKVRTWTDRSGSFSVDAQFLGLKDNKIHLHKMNGVKIAVPIAKMSRDDLEYVEKMTGISLDDDKPLADVKRSKTTDKRGVEAGASVSKNVKPEYDWFQFFLSCDVPVGLCERYAQAFTKDSMDESVLPDVNATILRTLGLREGDIIKVMRNLDTKFNRERNNQDSDAHSGGLFSGPGGALRNNTRKGRPTPAVQTSDVIDASALTTPETASSNIRNPATTSNSTRSLMAKDSKTGFDDDAWDVKSNLVTNQQKAPSNSAVTPLEVQPVLSPQVKTATDLTGSLKELSLLTEPLEPSKTKTSAMTAMTRQSEQEQPLAQQPTGATPSFFSAISKSTQSQGASLALDSPGSTSSLPPLSQRLVPTSVSPTQGLLLPPPPQRPTSTPQLTQQPSVFAAPYLNAQVTGTIQGQAAPGQSLNDMAQARLQQQLSGQYQQLQPAITGPVNLHPQSMTPFTTGVPVQQQILHPMMTGPAGVGVFREGNQHNQFLPINHQPIGYQTHFPPSTSTFTQTAAPCGNMISLSAPALEPQITGFPNEQLQQTSGNAGFSQPLQPQKTGPPPPVRFGISPNSRTLMPQQTGRRANLSQASKCHEISGQRYSTIFPDTLKIAPENPFGF
ncbi:hypothetical protein E4U43_006933 [Claviceps pusilla]|uniref:Actin cytoskeleton-regulatory complex protein SLA1 n=1 Tax=Claviceps pusilla TaxID=123648 RepID=A0A9P7NE94_9HYPO|nr:hypothetical protein E4U43_006933 [Claviceps pusilla]